MPQSKHVGSSVDRACFAGHKSVMTITDMTNPHADADWTCHTVAVPALTEVRLTAPNNKTWLVDLSVRLSQMDARSFCQSRGGDLLSIKSAEESQAWLDGISYLGWAPVWMGLQAPVRSDSTPALNEYKFVSTGQSMIYSHLSSAAQELSDMWGNDSPMCGALSTKFYGWYFENGLWVPWPCYQILPVACQLGEFGGAG